MPENLEPDVDEESEYDHDFEPERVCSNCDEIEDNCDCDVEDQAFEDQEECKVCGSAEDDPVHVEQ